MKGLLCSVYRDARLGDCTNGGVTMNHDSVILVGENVDQVFEANEQNPALKLVTRKLFGRDYIHAEPVEPTKPGHVGYMFGGNFIYSSDSRFPSDYPIPVHDRQETRKQYELLSR